MGIDDKFVVLYSGSLNEWQLPEQMIKIFKIINECINNSIFVMYTNDLSKANKLFLNSKVKNSSYIIDSKSYSSINKYLLAGDLGLFLNKVSSPIKFAEYISCGVPVLSSIPGDAMNLVERYNLGFKLKDFNDKQEIYRVVKKIKESISDIKSDKYKSKISKIIRKEMGWDNYINEIIDIYEKLLF